MRSTSAAIAGLLLIPVHAHATLLDDIGYTALAAELGASTPTAADMTATHVEAAIQVDDDGDPNTSPIDVWFPDPTDPQLQDKTLVDHSNAPVGFVSSHATSVGRRFYGSASQARGVNTVDVYFAEHWLTNGFLHTGSATAMPETTASRVANHSWVADAVGSSSLNGEILRRIDWLIATDEFVQVAGLANHPPNPPLLAASFNTITVGRSDGGQANGNPYIDEVYSAGRTRPDVVAPTTYTSASTPIVASAALLLADAGNDPGLAADPVAAWTLNRSGEIVYNGARAEIIRAAIMAGARRFRVNSQGAALDDYGRSAAGLTANGLDERYGAGQLDIQRSYRIVAAGEQNSTEDEPATGGNTQAFGFDYDPMFGGAAGTNKVATYRFATGAEPMQLAATLVWHIGVDASDGFAGPGTWLPNLTLELSDVDGVVLAASASDIDNTENVWLVVPAQTEVLLTVASAEAADFLWDYGLAWYWEPVRDTDGDGVYDNADNCLTVPNSTQLDADGDGYGNRCDGDLNNSGVVNLADVAVMRSVFLTEDPVADLDGNGVVSFADLGILKSLMFSVPGPSGFEFDGE